MAPCGLASDRGRVGAVGGLQWARALVLVGGWQAVWLLPRRPVIEVLIEMVEQLALNRGLRHGVVGAA
jgi:hypothetical protein